jgi:hypothetical protein
MEAAEAKIQRILQRDQQFLVPHFQRPYSWREPQWRVFGKLGVKLMMGEEEAAAMALLQADRPAIEQEIGAALEWNPHPGKKFKAIRLTRPTQLSDRSSWPEAITWLTGTAVAFKRAFAPRVAALEV